MPLRFARRSALEGREIACPLCQSKSHRLVGTRDRHFGPLTNVGCEDCGLIFTNPMPTDAALAAFYEQDYRKDYQGEAEPRAVHLLRGEQRAAARLDALRAFVAPGAAVLDLGAGAGEFVACLTKAGYAAKGLEPSVDFSAFARRHYGADVAQGLWQDLSPEAGRFDAITMHHVLEHLSDPVAVLMHLRGMLNENGILSIAVPNIADTRRSPQGRWHVGHVLSFAPETLDALAQKCGFEPVGGQGTSRVYRLAGLPMAWAPNPVIAQGVLARVTGHTVLRHYLGGTPYRRFVERTKRHAAERYAVLPPEKRTRLKRVGGLVGAALAVATGIAAIE